MVRSEKTVTSAEDEQNEYLSHLPVDKGWSWVVVAGCFGICAIISGTLKSFGVIFVEMSRRFDVSASLLTGPQSLAGFFYWSLGPFANALSERYSHRVVVFIGGVLATVGLVATSFVKSVHWFYVTYGIITGVGFGLTFCPTMTFQGMHFRKYRALANGLTGAGSGAGSFVLPYLIRFILDVFSLEGSLLIMAGIMLNTCVFATLFRPFEFWKPNSKRTIDAQGYMMNGEEVHDKYEIEEHGTYPSPVPECTNTKLLINEKCTSVMSKTTNAKLLIVKTNDSYHRYDLRELCHTDLIYTNIGSVPPVCESVRHSSRQSVHSNNDKTIKTSLMAILNWSLLKNPVFLKFAFAIFTGLLTHYSLFNVLPSIASERGLADSQGTSLVAILGIGDIFGRIGSGCIADFGYFDRATIFRTNLGLICVCAFILPFVTSFIGTCIIVGLMGLFSGGYIGIYVAVLADKFGVHNLPSSYGFAMFFSSFALLINPQIAGLIRDTTGSWEGTLYMAAISSLIGTLSLSIPPLYNYCCHQNDKIKEQTREHEYELSRNSIQQQTKEQRV